jgi:hypothetical protein
MKLKNLSAAEVLVPLDRKRHFKLAAAGDPGGLDIRDLDDRHLLPDRQEARAILELIRAGTLQVVEGSFSTGLDSVAVGVEALPALVGFDLVVDLEGAVGVDVPVGGLIPIGAILWSVQASIDELVVAGGTSVKVGIGVGAADPDKYGLSATLLKNAKTNFRFALPLAALAGAEQIHVSMVIGAGTAGDTAATAGKVRVKVAYIAVLPAALPDA